VILQHESDDVVGAISAGWYAAGFLRLAYKPFLLSKSRATPITMNS